MHLGGPKQTQGGEFLNSLVRNNAYEKRIMCILNACWIFLFAPDIDNERQGQTVTMPSLGTRTKFT